MIIKKVKLRKINVYENSDVYDIKMRDNHNLFANNILVHNCGEQVLPVGGVCLLGSLNLTQFINENNTDWDYEKLTNVIPIAVRFMDNVNDITYVPLEHQKQNLIDKRRMGIGIVGYGSALMMMRIKYGSEKALNITTTLMKHIANSAYKSSSFLAKEKGAFKLYDKEQFLSSNFLKVLDDDTINIIAENGMRNSHLLSIQPNGNSSIFINIVTGGLEPVFLPEYKRTSNVPFVPNGLSVPINIDWANKKYQSSQNWTWIKEGDELLLKIEFENVIYKFDRNRGLTKENIVKDYALRFFDDNNIQYDLNDDFLTTTDKLSIDEHVNTMKIITKYIDAATSKTINLPFEYSFEDFKTVYQKLYDSNTIKGGTTYRAGTMSSVISAKDSKEVNEIIKDNNAPKRPKKLACEILRFQNNKEKWIGFVGLLNGRPYEMFTGALDSFFVPTFVETGWIEKNRDIEDGKSRYDFIYIDKDGFEQTIKGLSRAFDKEYWNYGKLISGILRHGMPLPNLYNLVETLMLEDSIVAWKSGIKRMIKKYITDDELKSEKNKCPNCGSTNIKMSDGCFSCLDCSFSKCN